MTLDTLSIFLNLSATSSNILRIKEVVFGNLSEAYPAQLLGEVAQALS